MIHSFLLIGQSNAAGRGIISQAPPLDTCDGRLKVLKNGRWQTMFRPINPDRATSGTSFAESFAKAYAEAHPKIDVGIIPCADGGTSLEQWMPGELLFDNAINCAKLATRTSQLVGVLWHQGETDCAPERYATYTERFKVMLGALRNELNLPTLPILVGGLGDFLANCDLNEYLRNYRFVNEQLQNCAKECEFCEFVSAKGLVANPDNLHFDAPSLHDFGLRYFKAYEKMKISNIIVNETKHDEKRSSLEAL